MYVTDADHRRALALVGDVAQATTLSEFLAVSLPGLHRVLGADEVSYSEFRVRSGRVGPTFGYPTPPQAAAAVAAVWSNRMREHPWVRLALTGRRHSAVRLSELCSRSTLQRSPYYQDFYRPRGIEYADYTIIATVEGRLVGIALNRAGRDFTDDEHDVIEHLRRPLGGLWATVRRANELRSATAGDRSWSPPYSADLSPAENRVADLVARGYSNREVAAALGVSTKSVEQHLTRVYREFGVRSRSQLVRLVVSAQAPGNT